MIAFRQEDATSGSEWGLRRWSLKDDDPPFSRVCSSIYPLKKGQAGIWPGLTSLSSGCRSHTTPVSGSTAKKREASSPDTPNTRGSLSMSRASNWVTEEPGISKGERRRQKWEAGPLLSTLLRWLNPSREQPPNRLPAGHWLP